MSGGPSFLDGLGGFDLASLLEQMRQAPQGLDPQAAAPAPTMGLNPYSPQPLPIRGAGDDTSGHGVGSIDQRRPSIAMSEDQTQALERMQADPQGLAALGGSPTDRLLFDRTGFGGGPNGFTGSADPYASRMVPTPPARPSDADLLSAPTATGSLSSPRRPSGSSNVAPAPGVTAADTGNPASSNLQPVNSFDPLTGQPVSGSPKMLQAPGMGGPTAGGGQMPTAGGASQGGSFLERFANGLNNPQVGNLLLNVGIGLMSQRGFGPGIAAGLQGYQSSQSGSVKNLLEQYKLQQQVQGQQAIRAALKAKGVAPEMIEAAALNPTVLSNVFSQMNQKTPQQLQEEAEASARGSMLGGAKPIDRIQAEAQASAAGSAAGSQQPIDRIQAEAQARAAGTAAGTPSKPIQLRPGSVLIDPDTNKPLYEAPGNKPQGFETEDKLRTEFAKQVGTFNQVHEGYGRVIAATRGRETNPGQVSPASDMSLVFGYMKMLDPGSVVREGEYATAKNAAGVPEQVLNAYNKARNGEFLSDRQRQDFLGQAQELYGTARKTAEGVANQYRGLATQYGVSPDRSVYLPEAPTPPRLGQQGAAAGGPAARYQALIQSGMSKADAFAQMHKEGL